MPRFYATYSGTVESTSDSEQIGRLKVRVPLVYGPSGSSEAISVSDIPWALPAGLPAGGSAQSGGMVWLPDVGDHVWVRFLDGEPEKPIWEWGNQDTGQASNYPYFRLPNTGYGEHNTAPAVGMLTRYGHSIQFTPYQSAGILEPDELSPASVLLTSAGGYGFFIKDSITESGQIGLTSAKGYTVEIDDSIDTNSQYGQNYVSAVSYMFFIGDDYNWTVSNSIQFNAIGPMGSFTVSALAESTFNTLLFTLNAPLINMGTGLLGTPDAYVRLSDLTAAVNTIMKTFNSHAHTGNLGFPTSNPLTPLLVIPTASPTVFEV